MVSAKVSSLAKRKKADALILPFFEGKKPAFSSKDVSSIISPVLLSGDFTGKREEVVCQYAKGGNESRILLVGLGVEKEVTEEIVRRSYARATAFLKGKANSVNIEVPSIPNVDVTTAAVEGALLTNYVYDVNKSKKDKYLSNMTFIDVDKKLVEKTRIVCESVYLARNLSFSNADDVTPSFLGETAKELAKEFKTLKAIVLGPEEIAKEKLGLLMAVARGSHNPPALIVLEYKGAPKKKEWNAIIGKGVTYDTGGLNLKPTGGMETMRDDMSAAGSVLATMRCLAALQVPVNVVAVIGSTENAIGPNSYKPGDVYLSHAGITVEVSNTDAEGRLVLADALSYVQKKYEPVLMIDIATLTGGAIIALGEDVAALMSNDDELARDLFEAGEKTSERLWRLPLYEEYKDILKSKYADIKNSGKRKASAIQGGIFLQTFIKKGKWAHLDIAGTAFPDETKPYQPIQATGFGVRLLTTFFESLAS